MTDVVENRVAAHAEQIRRNGGNALALRLDVTDPTSVVTAVDKALDQYGRIDGLFHWWESEGLIIRQGE